MRIQIEKIEGCVDEHGRPAGYGEGARFTQDFLFEGPSLDDVPEHYVRAGEYAYWKGGFKKPPKAGTVENFDLKMKRDDPSKKISFKDALPDGTEIWRNVVKRAAPAGGGSYGGGGGGRASRPDAIEMAPADFAKANAEATLTAYIALLLASKHSKTEVWGKPIPQWLKELNAPLDPVSLLDTASKHGFGMVDGMGLVCRSDEQIAKAKEAAQAVRAQAAQQSLGVKPAPAGYEPPEQEMDDGEEDIPF